MHAAPIIGVVFPRLYEVYPANYIEIHQLCIILWLYTLYTGINIHIYSEVVICLSFFYKKSGELIH